LSLLCDINLKYQTLHAPLATSAIEEVEGKIEARALAGSKGFPTLDQASL
jgi:hypothetical protein